MNNATFPLIAFTSDTVSRLTGLTIRQIHYWDRNGFFTPAFADPHQRRPHSLVYTFVDLVGLRTIAELRTQGVTWPTLKRLRSVFQTADNVDWAKRKFYVVGRNAYFTHDEAIIAARPLGQSVLPTVLEIGPIAQSMERAVQSLPERGANQFG